MRKLGFLFLLFALIAQAAEAQVVIGISTAMGNNGTMRLSADYADAVRQAGGIPVLLPSVKVEAEADVLLGRIDALILTGGADVQPAYYGEELLSPTVSCIPARDSSDFLLVRTALRKGMPVLGICRGEQVLNVAMGGSLYQDLPSQCGVHHYQDAPDGTASHLIRMEPDSRIGRLFSSDTLSVNSFHHQSVKRPGNGLHVSARSADGVVEAVEGEHVIGVQFHPEKMLDGGDLRFLVLFQALVRDAESYAAARKGRAEERLSPEAEGETGRNR